MTLHSRKVDAVLGHQEPKVLLSTVPKGVQWQRLKRVLQRHWKNVYIDSKIVDGTATVSLPSAEDVDAAVSLPDGIRMGAVTLRFKRGSSPESLTVGDLSHESEGECGACTPKASSKIKLLLEDLHGKLETLVDDKISPGVLFSLREGLALLQEEIILYFGSPQGDGKDNDSLDGGSTCEGQSTSTDSTMSADTATSSPRSATAAAQSPIPPPHFHTPSKQLRRRKRRERKREQLRHREVCHDTETPRAGSAQRALSHPWQRSGPLRSSQIFANYALSMSGSGFEEAHKDREAFPVPTVEQPDVSGHADKALQANVNEVKKALARCRWQMAISRTISELRGQRLKEALPQSENASEAFNKLKDAQLDQLRKEHLAVEHELALAHQAHVASLEKSLRTAESEAQVLKVQLASVGKDPADLCSCPISFKIMRQPVLGIDLHTYEKDVIEEVLDNKPASPFTRVPMEKGTLRPNVLVMDTLRILQQHFPNLEDCSVAPVERPPAVGLDLVRAIRHGRSAEALEMLGRDVDPAILNGGFKNGTERLTLLQLSIRQNLPEVAMAIYLRPDFRRGETYSTEGLLAIHMAAAFHYVDLCRAMAADVPFCRRARTLATAELTDPRGRVTWIPEGFTAPECSRLFGHSTDWAE